MLPNPRVRKKHTKTTVSIMCMVFFLVPVNTHSVTHTRIFPITHRRDSSQTFGSSGWKKARDRFFWHHLFAAFRCNECVPSSQSNLGLSSSETSSFHVKREYLLPFPWQFCSCLRIHSFTRCECCGWDGDNSEPGKGPALPAHLLPDQPHSQRARTVPPQQHAGWSLASRWVPTSPFPYAYSTAQKWWVAEHH